MSRARGEATILLCVVALLLPSVIHAQGQLAPPASNSGAADGPAVDQLRAEPTLWLFDHRSQQGYRAADHGWLGQAVDFTELFPSGYWPYQVRGTNLSITDLNKSPWYDAAARDYRNSPPRLRRLNYRDITVGSNGDCGPICLAGPGYDFVTGLGSPRAENLVPFLANH